MADEIQPSKVHTLEADDIRERLKNFLKQLLKVGEAELEFISDEIDTIAAQFDHRKE